MPETETLKSPTFMGFPENSHSLQLPNPKAQQQLADHVLLSYD